MSKIDNQNYQAGRKISGWLKFIFFILIILVVHLFLAPRIEKNSWLLEHHWIQQDSTQPVIINKTEKITVKETFSVRKTAEKVRPAIVKIILPPKNSKNEKGGLLIPSTQTGFILSSDGLIVTADLTSFFPEIQVKRGKNKENKKSVKEKRIKIKTIDGKIWSARIIARDQFNHLAFLKIEGDNLPTVSFADWNSLENGEKVILGGTVLSEQEAAWSLNLIRYRSGNILPGDRTYLSTVENTRLAVLDKLPGKEFIGGPAIDFQGNVAGLVIREESTARGFIVPIINIKQSMDKLVANGVIDYPQINIPYLILNEELAATNNLEFKKGALVVKPNKEKEKTISLNSGAENKLRFGDIVVAVNNQEVTAENSLSTLINQYSPGEKITLRVKRGKEEIAIPVILRSSDSKDTSN